MAHRGGASSGEVVDGGGGLGTMRVRPSVVLDDGEDAQAMRKTTAMPMVVGGELGDVRGGRRRARGGGDVRWLMKMALWRCWSLGEGTRRCGRGRRVCG